MADAHISSGSVQAPRSRAFVALTLAATVQVPAAGVAVTQTRAPASAAADEPAKVPTARGSGGAVSSVDPYATRIGLEVLRNGGNATDAAVATAAALGVTEPYSAGVGGGGFFVHYDADTGEVQTIDGRETAPMGMPDDAFVNPETGQPYSFNDQVSSGLSVGVPGTLATWQRALDRWGTRNLSQSIRPATRLAREGFVVDQTFRQQTADNQARFAQFTSTRELFLPGGSPPPVGSTFRNPDLADTYELIAERGLRAFYRDALGPRHRRDRAGPADDAECHAPRAARATCSGRTSSGYRVLDRAPTHSGYRGYDVFGMRSSSSGGTTVGEALNILERYDLATMSDQDALHRYLEAGALAFADRGKYFGDERVRRRPRRRPALRRVRRRAGVPDQPDPGDGEAGPRGQRRRTTTATARPPTPIPPVTTTPRDSPRRTSPSPTGGATSSNTPSPSSRPVAPASSYPTAASCSTTS